MPRRKSPTVTRVYMLRTLRRERTRTLNIVLGAKADAAGRIGPDCLVGWSVVAELLERVAKTVADPSRFGWDG